MVYTSRVIPEPRPAPPGPLATPAPPPRAADAGPRPPKARLRLARRGQGPGAAVALLIHGVLVAALLWGGTRYLQGGGGGPGPLGGGGEGGGKPAAHFLTLPPAPPMEVVDVPAPPAVPEVALDAAVIPELAPIQLPDPRPVTVATPVSVGAGSGGGPGSGTGSGGGQGSGVGAHTGPGSGGDAEYISLPSPRWTIVPPMNRPASVRGRQFVVTFWVTADGWVAKVAVEPDIREGGYRRDFMERMKGYQFDPARNRDGRPVASIFTITLTM